MLKVQQVTRHLAIAEPRAVDRWQKSNLANEPNHLHVEFGPLVTSPSRLVCLIPD